MLRKLLARGSAGGRIQESQPKNNPFTGTEVIWNPWFFQFNEVTPPQHFFGSKFSAGPSDSAPFWLKLTYTS